MREELEVRTQDSFDGTLDAASGDTLARELEADPAALSEYADQLAIHLRLGLALRPEGGAFADAVARELRYAGDSARFAQDVVGRLKGRGPRRRWVELVAAAFVLGALAFFLLREGGSTPGGSPAELLFVVGRLPMETGDLRVKEHLEKTYRLVVRPANEVRAGEARGRALVVISSTVDEKELKGTFRDVDVPVLTWEPRLYHDLGMIPGDVYHQDWGTSPDQTRILTSAGPVAVTSRPAPISWGRARSDAVRVATLEKDADKAVIFHYEKGAAMPGLKAPARRAAVFLFDWTAMVLTPEGWAVLDESVRWCVGR
jgi:hypothetical protein